ncbi:pilus assembly protein TadG-related protein [Sedimentimonas flavescens]|uniref:Pilus assembly protein TadG-related protein n=1 Tax=Sedimentimonas flavescens TaxID=2851012 RepID=A0ABT2ZXJ5_9RHOB|nr:pilus assembly protein TadG-related protein [Sedimentimonas flavescens]MBW0157228.1 hypothetical protein [Sedimentimonas flavescens]MCT2538496.1 pilus assembly protein TadG-related protein [Sedimentimonas flavescens]MCV2878465.1 pilus assembly protein TadG-related protein [Sedimentimonas flavescens]WBL34467.1 pilus assembly protein TadG-related protein [Sinirhodobacter sp. HNIBRBA609]
MQRFIAQFRKEDGALSLLAIFWMSIFIVVGGLSLDVANVYRARTVLQETVDSAALGGLYMRNTMDAQSATNKALAIANMNLGTMDPGSVLEADVTFGRWNEETLVFTPDITSRSAVRVSAGRLKSRGNQLPTYLMRIIGRSYWDVATYAIAETYRPKCLTEGWIADGQLDLQSNNLFSNGFCLHSNTGISINQNNEFESGTIVSMPSLDLLDGPNSMFEKNEGLAEALRENFYQIRILSRIDEIIADMSSESAERLPDYIKEPGKKYLIGSNVPTSTFVAGNVYDLYCSKSNGVNIDGPLIKEVVIIAHCPVQFSSGAALEDVVLVNTSTDNQSIYAPSNLRIGKKDGCAEGGGAQIVTKGGFKVASGLSMYGGQIIAKGDVIFEANENGVNGSSIISGGKIDATSNSSAGYCGTGMEDNFELDYFRLVE